MTHKQFRIVQSELDKKGIATNIIKNGKYFECIVNFEIKKTFKTRASAKKYFIKLLRNEV